MEPVSAPVACVVALCLCFTSNTARAEPLRDHASKAAHNARLFAMPMELVRGLPVVRLQVGDKKDLVFIVDSGLQSSMISEADVERLSLKLQKSAGGTLYGIGDQDDLRFSVSKAVKLKYGGTTIAKGTFVIADLAGLSTTLGRPVDGILGYNYLRTHVITLDYQARQLVISSEASEVDRNTAARRFFVGANDPFPICVLDLTLSGQTFNNRRVMIDTGSDRSAFLGDAFVTDHALETLAGWKRAHAVGIGGTTSTLTGLDAAVTSADFPNPIPLNDIAARAPGTEHKLAKGFDLTIGAPVFAGRQLVFDVKHGVIYLLGD